MIGGIGIGGGPGSGSGVGSGRVFGLGASFGPSSTAVPFVPLWTVLPARRSATGSDLIRSRDGSISATGSSTDVPQIGQAFMPGLVQNVAHFVQVDISPSYSRIIFQPEPPGKAVSLEFRAIADQSPHNRFRSTASAS